MSEQGVDKEPIFDEGLATIHDELMNEIKNHFSAGEPTKQTSLNIALQYLNSGMMKAVICERKNKLQLEKEKAELREALNNLVETYCGQNPRPGSSIAFKMKLKKAKEVLSKLGGG